MIDWDKNSLTGESILLTDFALLSLARTYPTEKDRGNHKFTWLNSPTPKNPGVGNFVTTRILDSIPRYFFDEQIAKEEILASANLANEYLTVDEEDEQFAEKFNKINIVPQAILHGRHCQVTQGKFTTGIDKIQWYYVNVYAPKELEKYLDIDGGDCFPRFFLNINNALVEMDAWLSMRMQIANFSEWIDL